MWGFTKCILAELKTKFDAPNKYHSHCLEEAKGKSGSTYFLKSVFLTPNTQISLKNRLKKNQLSQFQDQIIWKETTWSLNLKSLAMRITWSQVVIFID